MSSCQAWGKHLKNFPKILAHDSHMTELFFDHMDEKTISAFFSHAGAQLYCSFVAAYCNLRGTNVNATPCTVSSLPLQLSIVLSNKDRNTADTATLVNPVSFRVRNNTIMRTSGHEEGEESDPGESITN